MFSLGAIAGPRLEWWPTRGFEFSFVDAADVESPADVEDALESVRVVVSGVMDARERGTGCSDDFIAGAVAPCRRRIARLSRGVIDGGLEAAREARRGTIGSARLQIQLSLYRERRGDPPPLAVASTLVRLGAGSTGMPRRNIAALDRRGSMTGRALDATGMLWRRLMSPWLTVGFVPSVIA